MKRSNCLMYLSLFLLTCCFVILPALGIYAQEKGRDEMSLYGGKSGPVPFEHHLHQTVIGDCQACHKDFPQEQGALEKAKADGMLKKKQVMNKTCIKCHRAKKKAGEKTGPTNCKTCHQK